MRQPVCCCIEASAVHLASCGGLTLLAVLEDSIHCSLITNKQNSLNWCAGVKLVSLRGIAQFSCFAVQL